MFAWFSTPQNWVFPSKLQIQISALNFTKKTPQPHPSVGEFSSPPLGGEEI
jgi:hypothetical protein